MDRFEKFFAGQEDRAYKLFGSHIVGKGVRFTVYAKNAYKVSLISSFDQWQSEYPLEKIDHRGIWELTIKNLEPIYAYRYRIYRNEWEWHDRIDPYAYCFERRPSTASCIYDLKYLQWSDESYLKTHSKYDENQTMNIYELHFNAFQKEGELASYRELKESLIPYLLEEGFNYVEFMPVFEHPFDGSWGYQATGFFGVTSRYGTPYDFADLINELHKNGIGILLDVVYVHFVPDEFGLVNYDFTPMYEYPETHLKSSEWGSYYFNLYSGPVISFLMSSANFFIETYHVDGLRFDAVSHFIYHKGNADLGRNEEGISFVKRLNDRLKKKHPNVILIAEDSSDFPQVTGKVSDGALGFDLKWDLGWMNDTLRYYAMDHEYRKYHHNLINFSMYYFYSEKFLLPFSHDESVHGKRTIVDKMFGTYEEKFRLCRNLYVYMFTHPGKKLNFMGNEIAQFREFDEKKCVDFFLTEYPMHDSFASFFRELNHLYISTPALNKNDYNPMSFRWIDADNARQSIFSYYRQNDKECYVVVLNMMPIYYESFELGVPYSGKYKEVINSEDPRFSGYGPINGDLRSVKKEMHHQPYALNITLAPFAGIVFKTNVKKTREATKKIKK